MVLMPVLGAEAAAGITRRGRATPRGPLQGGGGVIGPVTNPAQTVSDLGALSIRLSSQTPARRQRHKHLPAACGAVPDEPLDIVETFAACLYQTISRK